MQRRFCSSLGMNNNAVKAVQEAVKRSEELDIRYCFHLEDFIFLHTVLARLLVPLKKIVTVLEPFNSK